MEVYNNINDNKQNFDLIEAMYTGTVLNDDIILNADYTIVNKEMFEHICKQLGYKCNNIIMRNIHKDIQNQPTIIEINLLKVRVTTLTKQYEFSPIRVIQFSRYDKISDLYDRLIYPDQQDNYRVRLVNCSSEDGPKIIKDLENYYRCETDLENDSNFIKSSKANAMSLDLDKTSILIVENCSTNVVGSLLKNSKSKEKEEIQDRKGGDTNRDESSSKFLDDGNLKCLYKGKQVFEEEDKEEKKIVSVGSQKLICTRNFNRCKQQDEVSRENNCSKATNNFKNHKISNWISPQTQNYSYSSQTNEIKGSKSKKEEKKSEEYQGAKNNALEKTETIIPLNNETEESKTNDKNQISKIGEENLKKNKQL